MRKKFLSLLIAAVMVLAMVPATVFAEETTISQNTIWDESKTLTDDLTVEYGYTLTIAAQVTISGDVTISGGGTIIRNSSYVGDVDDFTEDEPDAAYMFVVPDGSSLTIENVTIDGGAGWNLDNVAPDVAYDKDSRDYSGDESSGTPVIGAMILNEGTLTIESNAVLQNNFNCYQSDQSAERLGGAVCNIGTMNLDGALLSTIFHVTVEPFTIPVH